MHISRRGRNGRTASYPLAALVSVSLVLAAGLAGPAQAATDYALTLKDHAFVEDTLHVPADTSFTLTVANNDAAAEEFESHDLHVEKRVPGNGAIALKIGPLRPGVYTFFGDFHSDTAYGQLIVSAGQ